MGELQGPGDADDRPFIFGSKTDCRDTAAFRLLDGTGIDKRSFAKPDTTPFARRFAVHDERAGIYQLSVFAAAQPATFPTVKVPLLYSVSSSIAKFGPDSARVAVAPGSTTIEPEPSA